MAKKTLVQLINENPGAVFVVDNDCWWMHPAGDWDEDEDRPILANDRTHPMGHSGYGSGNCYGGDILQALAQIVGVKVESV